MDFIITFFEGIISFISPCMLPMLPLYLSYFSAGEKKYLLPRSISFVTGFAVLFSAMGLFAGTLGSILNQYSIFVNIICGILVVIFGLSYLGMIPLRFFKGIQNSHKIDSILSAFIFGMIYSVSLTPCVGAFLGSALMLAASVGGAVKGLMLLLVYSLGLGIPFVLSSLLIEQLSGTFSWIKRHYKAINMVCGFFLIVMGIAMAFGWLNKLLSLIV